MAEQPGNDVFVGARVFSGAVGQEGVVVRVYGSEMATVRFPTGERTVPVSGLELRITDPLDLLAANEYGEEPEWFDIRLRAAHLQAAYGSDNLSGLVNSRVLLKPHQIFVAHKALEKPRPSIILADEVGLGKTVEAGLILKELLARRSVRRVLVIVPPNLLNQWHTELRLKFNEEFQIVDSRRLRETRELYAGQNPWLRFSRALVSSHLARDETYRDELVEPGWDLVIVDEAHHCRRKLDGSSVVTTHLYRTVDRLKDDAFGVLLLTATPMQLDHFELYSLVELVEPGLYQGYNDFVEDVLQTQDLRSAVRVLQGWKDASKTDRLTVRSTLSRLKVTADLDSAVAREETLERLLEMIRLTTAIVRNRKRTVGGFTRRRALTVTVTLSDKEQDVHTMLAGYLQAGFSSARRRGDTLLGFEMVTFQRLLASSCRALAAALRNRRLRLLRESGQSQLSDEDANSDSDSDARGTLILDTPESELSALDELIAELEEVEDSKVHALEQLVAKILKQRPDEKVLIFTQFLATQELICERLSPYSVVKFNGGMSRFEKDEAVRTFRHGAQVMVSTESGGEGRNLQFCHILVNYDLHWNPMRVEQRIGRLDRYGQTRNVHIYNLAAIGTIEDHLLDVFVRRLNLFETTVGALELVLGDVEDDLRRALLRAEGNVAEAVELFDRELDLKLKDAAQAEVQSADFLIELASFREETAKRLTAVLAEGRIRVDLEMLVLHILEHFPTAHVEARGDVYEIQTPPALARAVGAQLEDRYVGTFSAAVAVEDESLDFFGFGHALVDACMDYATTDASAGRAGVRQLPREVLIEPCVETNWVLEFTGVRKWARVESLVLSLDGRRLADVEEQLPLAEAATEPELAVDRQILERIRERALNEMTALAEREHPQVLELNRRHASQEAARLRRIHQYNHRRIEEKSSTLELRIQALQEERDSERIKIIPALRGQIDALGRDLRDLGAELESKLEDLRRHEEVSYTLDLINAALLLPAAHPND